jgi:hypothetical protein
MIYRYAPAPVVLSLLLTLGGCGSSLYEPVVGQVIYRDGAPVTGLEGGQIVFEAKTAEGKVLNASGVIDAQGKFMLGTETLNDGALAGMNKVLITPPSSSGDIPRPPVIDRKYESFEQSGIELEIKKGRNDLKVTVSPPPS